MKSRLLASVLLLVGGCVGPALCQEAPETPAGQGEVLVVRAVWPGQDLTRTRFYAFSDPEMKDLIDVFPVGGPGGAGLIGLKPGQYYLMAVVDLNGNDKPDAGDGFGFYGVEDCSVATRPQPFQVGPSDPHTLVVHILMTMDDEGKLRPVPPGAQEPGTVVGVVAGAGEKQAVVLLLPADEGLTRHAGLVREDGAFQLQAAPGTYGLLVVADADDNGLVTDGDLVGWKGQENPEGPDELTLRPSETVDAGDIDLAGRELLGDKRLPAVVVGRVPGAALAVGAQTQVTFYRNQELSDLAHAVTADSDARFCAALGPGTYYAKAVVDFGSDGAMTAGDMVGFYGVSDILSGERPQPLELAANELRADVVVSLTARLDEEGRLVALTGAEEATDNAQEEEPQDDGA